MSSEGLRGWRWQVYYGPSQDRLRDFYIPALSRSVSYDRSAGYFCSAALAIAAAGVTLLIRNGGRMRLLVGAKLFPDDVEAVEKGHDLRERIRAGLLREFEDPADLLMTRRLEALAWMIARNDLEIRVVVPKDEGGRPIAYSEGAPYFHIKTGVFADRNGDQVAFSGSVNESIDAWDRNYEDLAIYTSWVSEDGDSRQHLRGVVWRFENLWNNLEPDWESVELPDAVRDKLLGFHRDAPPALEVVDPPIDRSVPADQDERILFRFVKDAPRLAVTGRRASITPAVRPWPHQTNVADHVTARYPEGFLLCDEVGLGKTIEAGLILRALFLDGRVQRALVLAPKSVLKQFQDELYEKFVLDVPIYDSGVFTYRDHRVEPAGDGNPWDRKPLFLASSQLAKRRDRRDELLHARPFDLVLVDEAHHARRKGFDALEEFRPNNLLRLLLDLRSRDRARCILLMTATPIQIHPVEVYDLLRVLGLGGRWGADPANFLRFFGELRRTPAADIDWTFVLSMARDSLAMGVELPESFERVAREKLGVVEWQLVRGLPTTHNPLAQVARLSEEGMAVALRMVRRLTPLQTRLQRSTRELLRHYREKGILREKICDREPTPVWVTFTTEEERLYAEVERYVSDFYKRYEATRRGLGFVMTIYRRRLTSSFFALEQSLLRRLDFLRGRRSDLGLDLDDVEQEDLSEDILEEAPLTPEEIHRDEISFVEGLLSRIRTLPADSKRERMESDLKQIFARRDKVLIFTQYTDTMDYLRDRLKEVYGSQVGCYSGRGGELWDGTVWKAVTKEEIKARFKAGTELRILLGTEAMSEGLNLQTCGVLLNYDMPWNPMRVEQRIGRIDRIGQVYDKVWIRHYFYEKSVEAQVYQRLEDRINWFEAVIGELQPILSQIGKVIQNLSMSAPAERKRRFEEQMKSVEEAIREQELAGLHLDEYVDLEAVPGGAAPEPVSLPALEELLTRSRNTGRLFEADPDLPGVWLLKDDGGVRRVTFDPALFDEHPDTLRLMTFGEPALHAVLACVPEPVQGSEGRVLRCEAPDQSIAGYYRTGADDAEAVATIDALRDALHAGRKMGEAAREQASVHLSGLAAALDEQARGVQLQLARGEMLARQEEARALLRAATAGDLVLRGRAGGGLFSVPGGQTELPFVPEAAVTVFARREGPPFAPLCALMRPEMVSLPGSDIALVRAVGLGETALRARQLRLRDRALQLVTDLKAATKQVEDLAELIERPRLIHTVLR